MNLSTDFLLSTQKIEVNSSKRSSLVNRTWTKTGPRNWRIFSKGCFRKILRKGCWTLLTWGSTHGSELLTGLSWSSARSNPPFYPIFMETPMFPIFLSNSRHAHWNLTPPATQTVKSLKAFLTRIASHLVLRSLGKYNISKRRKRTLSSNFRLRRWNWKVDIYLFNFRLLHNQLIEVPRIFLSTHTFADLRDKISKFSGTSNPLENSLLVCVQKL